ncbi:TPA: ABC transporter substrate-binding protein [Pseudomonas aeruginosa]
MRTPEPSVISQIAPTGRLRAAINFGNPVLAFPDPKTGAPTGISVDLATLLAEHLGLKLELVVFDGAGKVFAALADNAWDVAFLAIDPVRAAEISFTPPYVIIEGTYLVKSDSPFHSVQDLDKSGVRIAVGKGAAYDLFLTRTLEHARLKQAETSAGAVDLFLDENLEAAAGVRQPLEAVARTSTALRVVSGRFTEIHQAMGVPIGRDTAAEYLASFIEELKASGFVAATLARHGREDATVAPPSRDDTCIPCSLA